MVIVEGWVKLAPGEIERLHHAAQAMIKATRRETGCLAYAMATDLIEVDCLRIIECWQDDAALAAHFATPHMATFNAMLAGAQIVGAKITAYDGSASRVLMER